MFKHSLKYEYFCLKPTNPGEDAIIMSEAQDDDKLEVYRNFNRF
jgi:hypothetical protein